MLQPTVRSQLARVNATIWNIGGIRYIMEVNYQPPLKVTLNQVSCLMNRMSPNAKHWFIGGERCLAVGVKLIKENNIIAIPTDTIYGLATLAQNTQTVEKLYELKGRNKNKPLAIALSSIKDIPRWAETDHLPPNLLMAILPGPVTVVLKRKPLLNPALNPGIDTIGIRVSESKFLRSLCRIINEPLALTSANSSDQPSSLTPDEFQHLWPQLGGIFYTITDKKKLDESYRVGSTVVDLTVPNEFYIIRRGILLDRVFKIMYRYGLTKRDRPDEKNGTSVNGAIQQQQQQQQLQ
ncbi:yrdC domain-containing protein, mitochondrial-like [Diachasma alloeum]|uniref:yrdC domain-containing protein, mitochondrial-like n=1 Tax=Diachasma alloeum TaxID=454923 RepID=UPI000738399F|nr:yrdC domain-containing protein, mitochondrial-like [Diachasma alloeum]